MSESDRLTASLNVLVWSGTSLRVERKRRRGRDGEEEEMRLGSDIPFSRQAFPSEIPYSGQTLSYHDLCNKKFDVNS